MKTEILTVMAKVASRLDDQDLTKEADYIDTLMVKLAEELEDQEDAQRNYEEMEESKGVPDFEEDHEECEKCGKVISEVGIDSCHCFEEELDSKEYPEHDYPQDTPLGEFYDDMGAEEY